MRDLEKVGHALRMRRHDLRWSQDKLSELTSIERTYISGIENGKKNVSLNIFLKLANALEINAGELLSNALKQK